MNLVVVPAFQKFDLDGNGTMDSEELRNLSKVLGHNLNDEQLVEAMRDLDMNNDGLVDLNEFSRWYFTGMKALREHTRTVMKTKSLASCAIESMSGDILDSLQ